MRRVASRGRREARKNGGGRGWWRRTRECAREDGTDGRRTRARVDSSDARPAAANRSVGTKRNERTRVWSARTCCANRVGRSASISSAASSSAVKCPTPRAARVVCSSPRPGLTPRVYARRAVAVAVAIAIAVSEEDAEDAVADVAPPTATRAGAARARRVVALSPLFANLATTNPRRSSIAVAFMSRARARARNE